MLSINFTLSSLSANLSLSIEADIAPPPSTHKIDLTYIEYALVSALVAAALILCFRWGVIRRKKHARNQATSVRFNHTTDEFELAELPTPPPRVHFPSDPQPSLFIPGTPSLSPKSDTPAYEEEEEKEEQPERDSPIGSSEDHYQLARPSSPRPPSPHPSWGSGKSR